MSNLNPTTLAQRTTFSLCGLLLLILLTAGTAAAQADPSLVELKAAAYDAQQAAAAADAAAAQARDQAADARAALDSVGATPSAAATPAPPVPVAPPVAPPAPAPVLAPIPAPIPAPVPVPVVAAAPPVPPVAAPAAVGEAPVTREELDRAIEKAENAAATARKALEELEAYKERHRKRYARNGLTMSAGAFWAPNLIDTTGGVEIDSSRGLSGGIGYRVHPHFSIDGSFVWVEGFTIEDSRNSAYTRGNLQMWSALFGGKIYMLTGKIQPYVGLGFGAAGATYEQSFSSTGSTVASDSAVGGVISFNGGIELYVSESLAIGADAAIYLPGADLRGLDFSTLGAKLIYRF